MWEEERREGGGLRGSGRLVAMGMCWGCCAGCGDLTGRSFDWTRVDPGLLRDSYDGGTFLLRPSLRDCSLLLQVAVFDPLLVLRLAVTAVASWLLDRFSLSYLPAPFHSLALPCLPSNRSSIADRKSATACISLPRNLALYEASFPFNQVPSPICTVTPLRRPPLSTLFCESRPRIPGLLRSLEAKRRPYQSKIVYFVLQALLNDLRRLERASQRAR